MKNIISKIMMAFLTVAVAVAAFPVTSAFATDETPPVPTDEKLEAAWAKVLKFVNAPAKHLKIRMHTLPNFKG